MFNAKNTKFVNRTFYSELLNLRSSIISKLESEYTMGSATGLKWGGAKTIIELESEPKFYINLYKKLSKILIHAFKY